MENRDESLELDEAELRDRLTRLVLTAAGNIDDRSLYWDRCTDWSRVGDTGWEGIERQVFRIGSIPKESENEIAKLQADFLVVFPEYANNRGTRIGLMGQFRLSEQVRAILDLAFAASGRELPLQEEPLRESIEAFWRGIKATEIPVKFLAIVQDLKLPCGEIKLSEYLRIRRLSLDEINKYYGGQFRNPNWPLCEFGLEGEYVEPVFPFPSPEIEEEGATTVHDVSSACGELLVRTLRLLTGKAVRIQQTPHWSELPLVPYFGIGSTLGSRVDHGGEVCVLSEVEAKRLPELFNRLRQTRDSADNAERVLWLAIRRLSDARARTNKEDSLLDAVIALEAILLFRSNDQLNYRFRMNYACLGSTFEDRAARADLGTAVYKARSLVAHGSPWTDIQVSKGEQKRSLQEIAELAVEMAHEVVNRALTDSEFCFWEKSYWDDRLLGREFPPHQPTEHQNSTELGTA